MDDQIFYSEGNSSAFTGSEPMKCYIYSLKNDTTKSIAGLPPSYCREDYGTYYDMTHESIYLLGGHGAEYCVNKYDIHKDAWSHTGTIFGHGGNSIAWMDGFVLYIVGDKEKIGTVECLDTRSYSSNWVLANKELQVDKILGACTLKRLFCNNIY